MRADVGHAGFWTSTVGLTISCCFKILLLRDSQKVFGCVALPAVSIAVPFFGLTNFILRIPKGNPQKGTTMDTIGISWRESGDRAYEFQDP